MFEFSLKKISKNNYKKLLIKKKNFGIKIKKLLNNKIKIKKKIKFFL